MMSNTVEKKLVIHFDFLKFIFPIVGGRGGGGINFITEHGYNTFLYILSSVRAGGWGSLGFLPLPPPKVRCNC